MQRKPDERILPEKYSPLSESEKAREDEYKNRCLNPSKDFRDKLTNSLGDKFSMVAQDFSDFGIVRIENFFSPDLVESMQKDVSEWRTEKKFDPFGHMQFDGATKESYLTRSRSMSKVVSDPLIWMTASYHWGEDPQLAHFRTYITQPIPKIKYRAFREHNDGWVKTVKVMVLLTDVPKGGQGMKFWAGTHKIRYNLQSSIDTLYRESDVKMLGEPVECYGPAGTVFLFDPNAVHSGTRNETQERVVFVATITIEGKHMFRIPKRHPALTQNASDYENFLFRAGSEADVNAKWQKPSDEARDTYIRTNKNTIESSLKNYVPMKAQYDHLNKLNLPYKELPFKHPAAEMSTPDINQPFPTTVDPTALGLLPTIDIKVFEKDLGGELDLPLRPYSGYVDRNRDLVLGEIRDSSKKEEKIREVMDTLKDTKGKKDISIEKFQNNIPGEIINILNSLNKNSDDPNEKATLDNYKRFTQDLEYCLVTAKAYAQMRASLVFIIEILINLKEKDKEGEFKNKIKDLLYSACGAYLYCVANTPKVENKAIPSQMGMYAKENEVKKSTSETTNKVNVSLVRPEK